MKPVVLIVGLMRSGTSLVAALVHHLGFQVSPVITSPCPPTWRSDWEDPSATVPLLQGRQVNWEKYFLDRRFAAGLMGFNSIAVKSPLLALHMEEIRKVEPDVFVVCAQREEESVERSRLHTQLPADLQERIREKLLWIGPNFNIHYEDIILDPKGATRALARKLDVDDEEMIARAALQVGKPTEYPCLQSLLQ